MMRWIKKHWQNQKSISCKTKGLAEKEEATRRKIEVAMSILNRRVKEESFEIERRNNGNLRAV